MSLFQPQASRPSQAPVSAPVSRCAVADISSIRDDRELASCEIDWDRLLTISYRHYAKRGGVVVDVGAHTGLHSRRLQRYLEPTRLVLFEPLPDLAAGLQREFRRQINTEVRQIALSNVSGSALFVENTSAPEASGLREVHEKNGAHTSPGRLIEVTVDRLDDQLDTPLDGDPVTAGAVSFIKIDVEGAELDVLRGAERVIRRDRPIISIDFGQHGLDIHSVERHAAGNANATSALLTFAEDAELSIVDLLGNVLAPDEFVEVAGTYYRDYLLIPNEKLVPMATARSAVRGEAFRAIDTYNPMLERWKKRFRF